ncbi:family 20 glycosylhydrolase [Gallaecimonas pentaromativorans]|uniref:beta-N-acetylhexosaminidase n=1 Tax=Gallaecimonas pentaromativorans TaxID=584787 RepID=A0A3N1PUB4_9GAMM|nr:family 20 glycosylhydrolase [Gallaecimonas pentaromativorans]ROQ30701.1 hexosaminidase [Gallaecimonas pentaromativorans]
MKLTALPLLLAPFMASALTQPQLDKMAAGLEVQYQVLAQSGAKACAKDLGDGHCFKARLTLTLPFDQPDTHWQLYLGLVNPVQSFTSDSLAIRHLNGDLHQITPKVPFEKGHPLHIDWYASFWQLSYGDSLPNFYLAAPGLKPALLAATRSVPGAVLPHQEMPFIKGELPHKRTLDDDTPVADANWYYGRYPEPVPASEIALLPNAAKVVAKGGRVKTHGFALDAKLAALTGLPASPDGLAVATRIEPDLGSEAYQLNIDNSGVTLAAGDEAGRFYGLETLSQLFDGASLPVVHIEDAPRYGFRGLHLDLARNFLGKAFVLQLIEEMAALKLNKLHLHLADDEGWRLAIPDLPELTAVASKRCHDLSERHCLLPMLGAGPVSTSRDGYLSVADYQDILKAAKARHIEVIPSLDMPGHSRAAIKAMEARFQATGDSQYRLVEPADSTRYQSVQYYNDNTLNPCLASTYAFTGKVFSALKAIHQQAGVPLKRYHIGADETAGAWADSPACRQLIKAGKVANTGQLLPYFLEKVTAQLDNLGIEAAAWSDGLEKVAREHLPAHVQANVWTPLYWGGEKVAHQMANAGFDVVYSFPELTYFDFPAAPDPQEPGYYWGTRYLDAAKLYAFMPDKLAANASQFKDRQQHPYQADHWPLEKPQNIKGIQAQLWSETVRSPAQAWYRLLPRLAIMADKAWHKAPWEALEGDARQQGEAAGYAQLSATISRHWLARWDKKALPYRIGPVGAEKRGNTYRLRATLPGLTIQVKPKGQDNWQSWQPGMALSAPFAARALTNTGRAGRAIWVNPQ